jgi:hypothetical protein
VLVPATGMLQASGRRRLTKHRGPDLAPAAGRSLATAVVAPPAAKPAQRLAQRNLKLFQVKAQTTQTASQGDTASRKPAVETRCRFLQSSKVTSL